MWLLIATLIFLLDCRPDPLDKSVDIKGNRYSCKGGISVKDLSACLVSSGLLLKVRICTLRSNFFLFRSVCLVAGKANRKTQKWSLLVKMAENIPNVLIPPKEYLPSQHDLHFLTENINVHDRRPTISPCVCS